MPLVHPADYAAAIKRAKLFDKLHPGLFVTDEELLALLGIDRRKGRLILRSLDDQHAKNRFPQKSKLWGKRYLPAVRQWLDRTNGVLSTDTIRDRQSA